MTKGAHEGPGEDKSSWDDECCAEHDGTIASFERLSVRLQDLEDYEQLFRRDATNMMTVGKVVGGTLAGVAVFTPLALLSAPAIASALGAAGLLGAASTGTAISTLSGAALTSASLAAIGGSMAAGAAVIGAAGGALGAWQGGVTSNAYFGVVKDFKIAKLNEGSGPALVFIDGFLTKDTDTVRAWRQGARHLFAGNPWYHLQWESGLLTELGTFVGTAGAKSVLSSAAKELAKRGSKKAANPLAWASALADLAGNTWHTTFVRAAMTGAILSDLLARTINPDGFILVGHSLGARVAACTLDALGTRDAAPVVRHAVMLGGATGGGDADMWSRASSAVSGRIHNCFSESDDVLRYLYGGASAFTSDPIGLSEIPCGGDRVRNIDVTSLVTGHMQYKPSLREVLREVHTSGTWGS